MTDYRNPRLSPKRQAFQWATSLTILLLPYCHWNGQSLLRLDFTSLSLYLFGQTLRIDELYLVLFFSLALGLAFLLATLVFGRVWCGWACPQTTLSDIAEWLAKRLGLKLRNNSLQGQLWRKSLVHVAYLALALLVGANLVWYFVEPRRFFAEILTGQLHYGAWITLSVVTVTVYLDFALIRRIMCRDFCPYGRFQTVLADSGTLTLHIPASEIERCIKCEACVRSCPMEIDIRQGYQVECINCGCCLDACRNVMNNRKEPGLIRYSFGLEDKGLRALLNPRTLVLTSALLILMTVLTLSILQKPQAGLKVARSHTAGSKLLDDDTLATFFSAWISNRSDQPERYYLEAFLDAGMQPLSLRGQSRDIDLAPGANREVQFVVTSALPSAITPIQFVLYNNLDEELARADASLSPP
jgi:polyferredoxin